MGMKVSEPFLVLFLLGVASAVGSIWATAFLLPIVTFFVFIGNSLPPLARYGLPILPFCAVIIGFFVAKQKEIEKKIIIVLLVIVHMWVSLKEYPHFITYSNHFIPVSLRPFVFTDSNIDWGQGLPTLQAYIEQKQPSAVRFSYFGRANAGDYGFISTTAWGSYKNDDICAFHDISYPAWATHSQILTIISVTNWHGCGYSNMEQFSRNHIQQIVAGSFFVF
jgi:hypothetical protein